MSCGATANGDQSNSPARKRRSIRISNHLKAGDRNAAAGTRRWWLWRCWDSGSNAGSSGCRSMVQFSAAALANARPDRDGQTIPHADGWSRSAEGGGLPGSAGARQHQRDGHAQDQRHRAQRPRHRDLVHVDQQHLAANEAQYHRDEAGGSRWKRVGQHASRKNIARRPSTANTFEVSTMNGSEVMAKIAPGRCRWRTKITSVTPISTSATRRRQPAAPPRRHQRLALAVAGPVSSRRAGSSAARVLPRSACRRRRQHSDAGEQPEQVEPVGLGEADRDRRPAAGVAAVVLGVGVEAEAAVVVAGRSAAWAGGQRAQGVVGGDGHLLERPSSPPPSGEGTGSGVALAAGAAAAAPQQRTRGVQPGAGPGAARRPAGQARQPGHRGRRAPPASGSAASGPPSGAQHQALPSVSRAQPSGRRRSSPTPESGPPSSSRTRTGRGSAGRPRPRPARRRRVGCPAARGAGSASAVHGVGGGARGHRRHPGQPDHRAGLAAAVGGRAGAELLARPLLAPQQRAVPSASAAQVWAGPAATARTPSRIGVGSSRPPSPGPAPTWPRPLSPQQLRVAFAQCASRRPAGSAARVDPQTGRELALVSVQPHRGHPVGVVAGPGVVVGEGEPLRSSASAISMLSLEEAVRRAEAGLPVEEDQAQAPAPPRSLGAGYWAETWSGSDGSPCRRHRWRTP